MTYWTICKIGFLFWRCNGCCNPSAVSLIQVCNCTAKNVKPGASNYLFVIPPLAMYGIFKGYHDFRGSNLILIFWGSLFILWGQILINNIFKNLRLLESNFENYNLFSYKLYTNSKSKSQKSWLSRLITTYSIEKLNSQATFERIQKFTQL